MNVVDMMMIIVTLALVAAGAALVRAHLHRIEREDSGDSASVEFREEVAKLRAEVRELKLRKPARQSTFMDMADALNRLANPPATYDEASLEVPLMDLALGKVLKVRLLSGKEAKFRLPAKTRSGTTFRFRRGGEEGRDLHLTVRATPEKSDGA